MPITAVAVLGLSALAGAAAWLRRVRRRRTWMEAPNYRQAIQAWAPETPMALPAIRPPKVTRLKKARARRKAPAPRLVAQR